MSFVDLVNKSWEDGKKGTDKVNIKEGIDNVLSIAKKVEAEKQAERKKEQNDIEK